MIATFMGRIPKGEEGAIISPSRTTRRN